ncbi:MAG: AzlC family ABC transporter permease [Clostridia bacterium]|nr:AzlC family ABC transporter permease [Clostridia bacterium]
MKKQGKLARAFRAAFPHTIPVLTGYLFLGITYGVYMTQSGFPFWYPMLTSLVVFGGSLEFVIVNLLLGAFNPVQAFVMALLVQARHLFYGISMLDKYRAVGKKKLYMIFGLSDETFSVNCAVDVPEDVDRGWFMFFVTILDQFYWFSGATIGGIFGSLISFNTTGLDFSMTAMFVVIFIEQWRKDKQHISALIGTGCSLVALWIFGSGDFLLPAMAAILAMLTLARKPIERINEREEKRA